MREVEAQELGEHVQDERRAQRDRQAQDVELAPEPRFLELAVCAVGMGLCLGGRGDVRLVTRLAHRLGEIIGRDDAGDCVDVGAFQRDIDVRLQHAGHGPEFVLDPAGAGTAGHAADAEREGLPCDAETRFADHARDRVHCGPLRVERHGGALQCEVDGRVDDAGRAIQRLLEPRRAGAAGHPLDRQEGSPAAAHGCFGCRHVHGQAPISEMAASCASVVDRTGE